MRLPGAVPSTTTDPRQSGAIVRRVRAILHKGHSKDWAKIFSPQRCSWFALKALIGPEVDAAGVVWLAELLVTGLPKRRHAQSRGHHCASPGRCDRAVLACGDQRGAAHSPGPMPWSPARPIDSRGPMTPVGPIRDSVSDVDSGAGDADVRGLETVTKWLAWRCGTTRRGDSEVHRNARGGWRTRRARRASTPRRATPRGTGSHRARGEPGRSSNARPPPRLR